MQQSQRGNQNVQIAGAVNSQITVVYEGQRRAVPLQPAVVAVGERVRSPARLLRARAGVIPYAARHRLLSELETWTNAGVRFAGCVVGGRGGSGKTRLAVAVCEHANAAGWLCGMLSPSVDLASAEELADTPTARLVIIDYAESRIEQLDAVLPLMAASATEASPVRVLLLVRAGPGPGGDWRAALSHHTERLDAVLDEFDVRALEDMPLDVDERRELFAAAAGELAARAGEGTIAPIAPDELAEAVFQSPLVVVIAAYLAVHRDGGWSGLQRQAGRWALTTSGELFDELLVHERRYWRAAADAHGLDCDDVLIQRVVALATLTGASSEARAVDLLRLVPDLAGASRERLCRMARWAHALYPGPGWWNALEPDPVGEHLVARTYASPDAEHAFLHTGSEPALLAGVLETDAPEELVAPLDLYARAATEHRSLAQTLTPIFGAQLPRLCAIATTQIGRHGDLDLLGDQTVAATLVRVLATINVDDHNALMNAIGTLPQRPDVLLGPLALALGAQAVAVYRRLAKDDAAAYEPDLAKSLDHLSSRLAEAGRHDEGLAASQEAVTICRRLANTTADAHEHALARALNNLANHFSEVGRHTEGLAANQEAVTVFRQLVRADRQRARSFHRVITKFNPKGVVTVNRRMAKAFAAAREPDLATALSNLSTSLARVGRRVEALAASQEADAIYRRVMKTNAAVMKPSAAALEPDHASSLNNLSAGLMGVGERDEGLTAIEEAVTVYRRLAKSNAAAYGPDLAMSLKTLSTRLSEAGRRDEALAPIQEAVSVYRRLVKINAAAYEPALANSLNNLSIHLTQVGRDDEGIAAIQEAVAIHRRFAEAYPAAHEPDLAMSLKNLSAHLGPAGRHDEALAALQEAATLYRRLAEADAATYDLDLAMSLIYLSLALTHTGSRDPGLAAMQEAVTVSWRLGKTDAAAGDPTIEGALDNLSIHLAKAGRRDEADQIRRGVQLGSQQPAIKRQARGTRNRRHPGGR